MTSIRLGKKKRNYREGGLALRCKSVDGIHKQVVDSLKNLMWTRRGQWDYPKGVLRLKGADND